MSLLRTGFKLIAVLMLLALGVLVCAVIFPCLSFSQQSRTKAVWMKLLLCAMGVRVHVVGVFPSCRPLLVVANHLSWLDIVALNYLHPLRFVAKSDIRRWPVLGWLTKMGHSVFILRGRRHAVRSIYAELEVGLKIGHVFCIFPEGKIGDGQRLLPFHTGVLGVAAQYTIPVVPVSIHYRDQQGPSRAAHYFGAISLWRSFINTLQARGLLIELTVLPILQGHDRHVLAQRAHKAIAEVGAAVYG